MLEEHTENLGAAAWSVIFAAWVCDDEQLKEQASDCRRRAYELIQRIQLAGGAWMPQPGADVVMCADLLRRAGLFDEAEKLIDEFERTDDVDDFIKKLVSFELELVKARDSACHTLAEVVA
jgi:vacuolar-type H+-ATPase catalytic subunit A/Vma1